MDEKVKALLDQKRKLTGNKYDRLTQEEKITAARAYGQLALAGQADKAKSDAYTELQKLIDGYNAKLDTKSYGEKAYQDANDYVGSARKIIDNLKSKSGAYGRYWNENEKSSFDTQLNDLSSKLDNYLAYSKQLSAFETEDEYNEAMRQSATAERYKKWEQYSVEELQRSLDNFNVNFGSTEEEKAIYNDLKTYIAYRKSEKMDDLSMDELNKQLSGLQSSSPDFALNDDNKAQLLQSVKNTYIDRNDFKSQLALQYESQIDYRNSDTYKLQTLDVNAAKMELEALKKEREQYIRTHSLEYYVSMRESSKQMADSFSKLNAATANSLQNLSDQDFLKTYDPTGEIGLTAADKPKNNQQLASLYMKLYSYYEPLSRVGGNKAAASKEKEYDSRIAALERDIAAAESMQKIFAYESGAMNDPDFEYFVELGKSVKNPSYDDAQPPVAIGSWEPFGGGDPIGNKVTFADDNFTKSIKMPDYTTAQDRWVYQVHTYMTDEEKAVYNYYIGKGDSKAANDYLKILDMPSREENQILLSAQKSAKDMPVLSSITSVITSLGSGIEYIGDLFTGDDSNTMAKITNVTRGTVSEDIDSDLGKFFYNTAMSGADSWAAAFMPGGSGAAMLGLSAAASAQQDALDRGLSKEEAFFTGMFSGIFEGLFENWSIGELKAFAKGTQTGFKGFAKGLAKSMWDNAKEETLTEIANIAYDTLANADLSNYEINVRYYMAQGDSEAEARAKAKKDLVKQVAEAGASGALMGFGFGGIGGGVSLYKTNKNAKNLYGSNVSELIDASLEIDPNNALALKLKDKLDSKKKVSGLEMARLVEQNESGMRKNDTAKIAQAAAARLTQLGETGDVEAISKALAKQAAGDSLTRAEQQLVLNSDFGERLAIELDADIINETVQDGGTPARWTGKIGTDRVNADEYSRLVQESEMGAEGAENVSGELSPTVLKTAQGVKISMPAKGVEADPALQEEKIAKAPKAEADIPKNLTVENASKKYGAQAGAFVHTYHEGQDVAEYDHAYRIAYNMGKSGVSLSYALGSAGTAYLTDAQIENAHAAGADAAGMAAKAKADKIAAKGKDGKTERRKGTVKGEGVTIEYLRRRFKGDKNSPYRLLSTIAEVTGIDIVLYKSETDKNGKFVGAQGKFVGKDNTIHIDINAGLFNDKDVKYLAKHTMMRTFAHEFTHFIEKWDPTAYNEFRKLVFDTLEERGENVDDLILAKQIGKLTYEEASREVVAEAMTDILPDTKFIENLAQNHKGIFDKLFDKLKEFVRDIKKHFGLLSANSASEANALKEQVGDTIKYLDSIVQMFDKIAVEAVENYQATVAAEANTEASNNTKTFKVKKQSSATKIASTDANITDKNASLNDESADSAQLIPGEEGTIVNEDGEPVAHATEDGTVQLSMRTYEEDGRKEFRKYLEKCVKNNKLTKTEMQEMMDGIEDIYMICKKFKDKYAPFSTWSDAAVVRDTFGKPVFSVVTPNGDYKMNLDFSLVCKKRRTLDAVFNEMAQRGIIDNFELGQKSVVKINEIIRKYGLETACALCFVDAKRFRQASMADQFTKLYNELVYSLVPEDQKGSIDHFNFSGNKLVKSVADGIHTWDASKLDFSHLDKVMKQYGSGTVEHKTAKYLKNHAEGRRLLLRGDFMSSEGFDAVKTNAPDVLKLYNSKKGTGGPKAAFGDVQYMNEVIKKAKSWTPKKAHAVGGVRIQSFPDYVPRMVFDYVQMIYDLAATKLPAHAYTKEALFVKQFGLTGVKINMSLIPAIAEGGIAPGLDANGDYVWAGESFDYETAKQIQNAEGYSENCGTICVGVSYAHIKKLLSDPNIRMVIPYHKSGLNPIVAHMNKIAQFTDYTNDQRTKGADGKALETEFDFNKTLHDMGENASPKAVADAYLKWCHDNGYRPKFAEFSGDENYYKLLEDFTLYDKDGKYVPQRAVKAVFPGEGAAFGSMKELIMEGLEEDAIIEGKRESSLGSIVDEIEQTLPKTEAEIDETPVEQADHDLEAVVQEQSRSYLSEEAEIFRHEIDRWNYDGRKNGETFILGSTGDVLQGLGAIDNDIYMLSDKINAIFKDHPEMTIKEIKNIPEILENPVMVLASRNTAKARNNTRLSIFGMVKAKNGMPVLVIFDLHPVENKLYLSDMQKVVSAYTKDNSPNAAMKLMQNSEVLYADKNKTASLLHTVGFQNAYRIEQSGYIGSISYDDDFVNISGQPFSEIFADGEDVDQAKSREYLNSGDEAVSTFYSHMGNEGQVQYQEREETWSAHELIEYAAEHLDREGLTEGERATLDIIKGRLDKLSGLEDQRYELGRLYKEQQFSENGDREEAKKTLNRMHVLDGQIKKALEDVLPSETVDAFNRVLRNEIKNVKATDKKNYISLLKKAKDELTDKANKRIKERIDSMRERRDTSEAVKKYRERIRADAKDMMNWINHPDNKSITNHVPDALKSTVIPFLSRLNFLSKKALSGKGLTKGDAAYLEELKQVQKVLAEQTTGKYGNDYSDYVDLAPDFMERLQMHVDIAQQMADANGGEFYINKMTAEDLKSLSKLVKSLKRYIMQFNKFHYNEMFKHVADAGDALIDEMLQQESDKGRTGAADDYVRFKNARPTHVLERFGKAGIAIRDALQKAEARYAFNAKTIVDELHKICTTKESAKWRHKTKTFKLSNGTNIEMRLSHMMGLYLLYKQEDSRRHMLNGGIRVGNFRKGKIESLKDSGVKAVKKEYRIVQQDGKFLTEADIEMIIEQLTDRQKEVADKLQKFMAETGAEWGNYVTLARFGEKMFGANKQYYPIKVDPQMLSAEKEEMPEGTSLYAMLNMGFTKSRKEGANNRIMLYDIFDVYLSHMSSMAQYNSYALAALDATKWLNYKQIEFQELTTQPSDWEDNYQQYYSAFDIEGVEHYKHVAEKKDAPKFTAGKYYRRVEKNTVRQQLTRVFGSPVADGGATSGDMGYAVKFLENLLKDINGTGVKGSEYDGLYLKVLHKYNRVKVALNLRTAVLQVTAITKAGHVVDYRSILKALNPKDVKKNMAEMLEHSGIAVRKNMGFYDMNISRTLTQIALDESSFGDKVTEKGLWLAEKADIVTWSAIWGAAKKDVIRNQKLKESDKGFYEAVTKVFEEIIYKTQVVDSVLTKPELMRSKSAVAKTVSSFMSESVTAASLMVSAGDQFERDARNMGRGKAFAKNKKQLAATIYNYALTAVVASVVGGLLHDVWADDDEYEEWYEKLMEAISENLLDELDLLEKIPGVADAWEPTKALVQKSLGGDPYEPNVTTPVFDIVQDAWNLVEIMMDDDTKYTTYGKIYKMLQLLSSGTGLPLGTATREAVLLWNNTFAKLYPELKVQTYDAGDKNEIKYAYLDGYLTEEEATKELINKGEAKNEYEAFFMIQGWDHGKGYTKIGSYYDAITSGDDEQAQLVYDNLYNEKIANGELSIKAKNSIASDLANEVKKRYIEGEITKEQAKDFLSDHAGKQAGEINQIIAEADFKIETKYSWDQRDNAYRMGEIARDELIRWTMAVENKTWTEADAYVDFLDLGMDYQDLDITQAITQDYFEYAEPAGITIDTYLYFYDQQKQIEGGKAEIMEFIDSLPLSAAQKDALYYAKGWAESEIHEAPWR